MMFQSVLATFVLSVQSSEISTDEATMLSVKVVKHDELEGEEEFNGNAYCAAVFHTDAPSVATCTACVTSVKADNNLGTTVMVKSPWFVKEVASCILEQKAAGEPVVLPPKLNTRLTTCSGIFGQGPCVNAVAHCLAVHADEALASCSATDPEGQYDCMSGHEGYLSCVAHNLDHQFCLQSPMGAGNCMKKGIECIDDGFAHGSAAFNQCFGQKRAAYFAANPAQKEVYDMCDHYYGQGHANDQIKKVALAKCGGCGMAAKMDYGNLNGHSCVREHCLRIPALVQSVTQCMMNPDVPCDALNTQFIPGPFANAEATCSAVFPGTNGTQSCLRNGAACLGLHPCQNSATCANDDGWFACFAKKMEFTACERHPAGMATCLKCGVKLIKEGICADGTTCVQQYQANDATVVGAHNTCVAASVAAAAR